MDGDQTTPTPHRLARWNTALLTLIVVGCVLTGFQMTQALWGEDFAIAVNTEEGVETFDANDFTPSERLAVVAIVAAPALCWVAGLLSLTPIPLAIRRGELLGRSVVRGMRAFGWWLVAMSATDGAHLPATSALLVGLGKCGPIKHAWLEALTGSMWDSLVAAILVVVLSHLLELGAEARDEILMTV